MRSHRRFERRQGFTLIELLLVLVILAVLATIVVSKFTGTTERANQTKAKADISNMKVSLDAFEADNGRFPKTDEGLGALVTNPGDLPKWKHPYIDKVPTDPWEHPYVYRCPGSNGHDYDLISMGPDGHEGTADDIGN